MMRPNPALSGAAASPARMAAARQRGLAVAVAWRARPDVAALEAAMHALTADVPADAMALSARFDPWLSDFGWLTALIDAASAAMRADPFTAFPLQAMHGRVVQSLALLQAPHADVTLSWVNALTLPHAQDQTLLFSDTLSLITPLRASGLTVQSHLLERTDDQAASIIALPPRTLADGEVIRLDNRREHLAMLDACSDAVLLRISCRLPDAGPQCCFDALSGQPCGVAMGDDSVSRMLPLLAVARLSGQAGKAAATLQRCARHPDPVLRWAAVREWLVADPHAAVAVLHAMTAHDPDVHIRAAAAATLDVLNVREPDLCPA